MASGRQAASFPEKGKFTEDGGFTGRPPPYFLFFFFFFLLRSCTEAEAEAVGGWLGWMRRGEALCVEEYGGRVSVRPRQTVKRKRHTAHPLASH